MKRAALRHLLATVAYRGGLAVADVPESFATYRAHPTIRTPSELLAHIGDLLQGSLYLCQGQMVYLISAPLAWRQEIVRFFSAVQDFDAYLATDAPLACPVEKLIQGPVGDALTHIGQIVMLRRMVGHPLRVAGYFAAEIVAGEISAEDFTKTN